MNKGRYCPVFNSRGLYKDTAGKNWYETTYPINSVADAFKSIGTALAQPDSKTANVHKNDFIPLFTTIQEDSLFEAEKRRSSYYNGSSSGVSGLVSIDTIDYIAKTATHKTLPILSNDTSLVTDIIGDPSQYKATDALYTVPTSVSITNMPLNTLVWDTATGNMYKALNATNDIDVNGVPVPLFTDTASWTLVQKGYPTSWLSRLAESKPLVRMYANLVNVNDGSSNLVTRNSLLAAFKFMNTFYTIYTDNSGQSYIPFTSGWLNNNITNSVDSGLDYAAYPVRVHLANYTKANQPLIQSTPKPIEYISPKEVNTNSHSIYKGNLITNAVTGGIATADVAVDFESKVLENGEIDNVGTIVTTPKHTTPTLTSSTSKASKSFFTTAKDSKGVYDMILGQGMVDATGYHSTKFTNLTNGPTLDDVGTTVNTKVLAKQTQYRR